jgi:hypothetical protein
MLPHSLENCPQPCPGYYLTHSNGTKHPWTKTSETVIQNKSFLLLSCLSLVFSHSNRKLMNTTWECTRITLRRGSFLQINSKGLCTRWVKSCSESKQGSPTQERLNNQDGRHSLQGHPVASHPAFSSTDGALNKELKRVRLLPTTLFPLQGRFLPHTRPS